MRTRNTARKKVVKLKGMAEDHEDLQWLLDRLDESFDCIVSSIKDSDRGGAHVFIDIIREAKK